MGVLFLIVFVDLVGFGIVIPLLPFYGSHFGASPSQVGLLMASYSLAQFFSAPLWGRLSDQIGRRPVLIVTLAGLGLSYLGLAFATEVWMLFVARLVAGAMAGNLSTAFAYAADVSAPTDRAKAMGILGAAFGLGFVLGPGIGGALAGDDPATANFRTPALLAAGLSLLAFGLAIAFLKESLSCAERAARERCESRLRLLAQAMGHADMAIALAITFLATFVFAAMEGVFGLWTLHRFGWGPQQAGYVLAFVGAIAAVVQGGLVGRLAKRLGEGRLVAIGAAQLAAGMAGAPFAWSLPPLLAAMGLLAAGFALMSPSLNSLVSLRAPPGMQGGVMGVSRSVQTLSRVLGPAAGGMLFEYAGWDWPFFAGAAVMAVVFLIALQVNRRPRLA